MESKSLKQTISQLKQRINNPSSLDKYNKCLESKCTIESQIKENFLKIISWNVGKMKEIKKRSHIMQQILQEDPDIVVLQETNLISDDDFIVPGYTVKVNATDSGLLCMIRNTIMFSELTQDISPFGKNIEHQIFKITLKDNIEIHIINIYRNPIPSKQAVLAPKKLFEYMERKKNL